MEIRLGKLSLRVWCGEWRAGGWLWQVVYEAGPQTRVWTAAANYQHKGQALGAGLVELLLRRQEVQSAPAAGGLQQ